MTSYDRRKTIWITQDSLSGNKAKRKWHNILQVLKENNCQSILISSENTLQEWRENQDILRYKETKNLFLAAAAAAKSLQSCLTDSVRPHRRQPTGLHCPWDSPGKDTGVGCHFLLQCIKVKSESEVAQSCPTLSDPIDGSPPGSPVPGILQARTLEWVAISFPNAWKWKVKVKSLSRARLLATPWTAVFQAPPSMGFARQEYWSGVPLPSLQCYHY